jgi:hypothetical protein
MKRDTMTDTNEIQNIRGYFENLYSNKLDNQEKMDKFLDILFTKLNFEELNNYIVL